MSGLTARVTLSPTTVKRRPPRLIILDRAYFRRILNRILYRTISTLRAAMRCFTCSLTDRIATLLVRKPTSLLSRILTFSFGPVHCFVYTFCRRPSPGSYSTVQRQYSCHRLPFLRHVRASAGPGQSAAPAAAVCHDAADHPQPQPFVLGAGSRLHKARRARFVQQLQAYPPFVEIRPVLHAILPRVYLKNPQHCSILLKSSACCVAQPWNTSSIPAVSRLAFATF